jgi:hypothetical protein
MAISQNSIFLVSLTDSDDVGCVLGLSLIGGLFWV